MDRANAFKWRQDQAEMILLCVRWYPRYSLKPLLRSKEPGCTCIAPAVKGVSFHEFGEQSMVCFKVVVLDGGIQQTDADAVFAEAHAADMVIAHQAHERGRANVPDLFDLGHDNSRQHNRVATPQNS